MSLPVQKSDNQELMLMQNRWKAALDPLLKDAAAGPSTATVVTASGLVPAGLALCNAVAALALRIEPSEGAVWQFVKTDSSANTITISGQSFTYTLFAQNDSAAIYSTATGFQVIDQSYARQVEVGTPQTAIGTVTSATYATPPHAPTITFTPRRTGTYRIAGAFIIEAGSLNVAPNLSLLPSGGITLFSQELVGHVFTTGQAGGSPGGVAYVMMTLTAGTSYTFTVQLKSSSGSASIRNDVPTNGIALTAEELQ